MSIKLYSKFHRPIDIENKFPPGKPGRLLSANHYSAEDGGNQFLFQELVGNGFIFRFNHFTINQPSSFTITSDYRIFFQISMYETTEYELMGYGNITLHQRSYNLITVPSYSAQFKTMEPSLLMPIEIAFTKEYLASFADSCPYLGEFIKNVEKGRPAALYNVNQVAGAEMMALIDLIILYGMHLDRDIDWLNFFVAELFHHALIVKPRLRKIKTSKEETSNIYEAEHILDDIEIKSRNKNPVVEKLQKVTGNKENGSGNTDNIGIQEYQDLLLQYKEEHGGESDNEKPYHRQWTIDELAEYANMSNYTFNKLFREIFGLSVPNYLKETTWQAVLQALLLGIENMKTISALAGYNDQPSFSRAFKKRFGYTPSEFVQEMKKKFRDYKKTAKRFSV